MAIDREVPGYSDGKEQANLPKRFLMAALGCIAVVLVGDPEGFERKSN